MENENINLPGYKIIKKVGKGGMATLYKAIQLSLDRTVAIKQLHSFLVEDNNFIMRFQREAKTLSKLEHPNIVRIYEFVKRENDSFIIMEFVEGVDLKFVIKKLGGRMPEPIALMFIYYIVKGLTSAHNQDIIHRDIKPANILISKSGYVKIVDFGLARSEDSSNLTMTGTLMGTPAYMSPEQAKGEAVNNQTDIFATGIILYELLTGKKPYPNEKNFMSIITHITSNEPLPTPDLNPPSSQKVIQIYQKMVEKDLEKRYHSGEEILKDLEDYFSEYNLSPDENIIKEFLKSPNKYWEQLKQEHIKKELEHGEKLLSEGKNRYSEALLHFKYVLKWDPNNTKAKNYVTKIEKDLKKGFPIIIPIISIIALVIAMYFLFFNVKTTVSIVTHPDKALVFFDGHKLKNKTPLQINAKPGTHSITIKKMFYFDKNAVVSVQKGQKASFSFDLVPWNFVKCMFIVKPSDAKVYIDGKETPLNTFIKLPLSKHTLLIMKEGYYSVNKVLDFSKASLKKFSFFLKPSQKLFTIDSNPPGAKVFLDDKLLGKTPLKQIIPFGKHLVKVVLMDYETINRTIDFQNYTPNKINFTLKKKVLKYSKCYFSITNGFGMVYIDDKNIGYSPIKPQTLSVGKHQIKIIGNSIEPYSKTIIVKEGINKFKIKLKKNWGYIVINSIPWAYVYLDGKKIGVTPIAKYKVKTGKHTLEFRNPKCNSLKKTIVIKSGKTISISEQLTFK